MFPVNPVNPVHTVNTVNPVNTASPDSPVTAPRPSSTRRGGGLGRGRQAKGGRGRSDHAPHYTAKGGRGGSDRDEEGDCNAHRRIVPKVPSSHTSYFRPSLLGLIAAGVKRLDMRLASDTQTLHAKAGTVLDGFEPHSGYRCQYRVLSVRRFTSAAAAAAFYVSCGELPFMFPSAFCSMQGIPVTTPALADEYFYSHFNRRQWQPADRAVRVLAVTPVLTGGVVPGLAEYLEAGWLRNPLARPRQETPPSWSTVCDAGNARPAPHRAPRSRRRAALPPRPCRGSDCKPKRPCSLAGLAHAPHLVLSSSAAAVIDAAADAAAPGDAPLIERITAEARRRARIRGSTRVEARDVRDAASSAGGSRLLSSPAEVQPDHFDEVVDSLAALRSAALELVRGGIAPPKVLIACEKDAVGAKIFKQAGCDVATCDWEPSSCADIPHYQGDVADIQDLGWTLVLGHPPCTASFELPACYASTEGYADIFHSFVLSLMQRKSAEPCDEVRGEGASSQDGPSLCNSICGSVAKAGFTSVLTLMCGGNQLHQSRVPDGGTLA